MKTNLYISFALSTLLAVSCIDDKEYSPKLPQDPSVMEPKEYALPIDEHKTFRHPGCMAVQEDFDRAVKHVSAGDEPWTTAFEALKKGRFFSRAHGVTRVASLYKGWLVRASANKSNYMEELDEYYWGAGNFAIQNQDCTTAYSKAVYWKLTGDKAYADDAVNILNAWAGECKGITGDNNKFLAYSGSAYEFASVAELLRDYEGWKAEDQAAFKEWIVRVHVPTLIKFLDTHESTSSTVGGSQYWSNWDLMDMLGLMSIGIYCDRPDLYNKVINYVTYGGGNGNFHRFVGYIHPAIDGEDDIDLGQTQEAGRDQGHNLLSIRLAAALCRIAWNQGDDLYGYDDNRFLKGAEFVAKYNYGPCIEEQQGLTTPLTYPFHAGIVNASGTYHEDNSTYARGQYCAGFVSVYEHYKKYKGLSTRYVKWAAKTPGQNDILADTTKVVNIEPETYDHDSGSGSGHGTLLFTEDESRLR